MRRNRLESRKALKATAAEADREEEKKTNEKRGRDERFTLTKVAAPEEALTEVKVRNKRTSQRESMGKTEAEIAKAAARVIQKRKLREEKSRAAAATAAST